MSDRRSGSLPSPPHLLLSTHRETSFPPPPPPPPARFLLPHPTVRSESCAYDTSVCCHGNGRIKAGARSAGIRPLRYLSSCLNRLPQGFGCPPQAPRFAGRPARARYEEVPVGRRSLAGPGRRARPTPRPGQRVAGPARSRRGHLPSLSPRDRSPRGSHVGARLDFPTARTNFAALGNELGCRRVVVRWSQVQIFSC